MTQAPTNGLSLVLFILSLATPGVAALALFVLGGEFLGWIKPLFQWPEHGTARSRRWRDLLLP